MWIKLGGVLSALIVCAPAFAQTAKAASPTAAGPTKKKTVVQEEPIRPIKPEAPKTQEYDTPLGGELVRCCERPSRTWSPMTCGAGGIVLESGAEFVVDKEKEFDTETFRVPSLLRYGLSQSFELMVLTDALVDRRETDPATGQEADAYGVGDVTVGTKWGMIKEGALPSIGSIALWKLPTADDEKGLGTGEGDLYFITSVGKTVFDTFSLVGNFGLAFISDTTESQTFRLRHVGGVEARLQLGDLTLYGEVSYLSPVEPMFEKDMIAKAGVAFFLTEDIRAFAAVGAGIVPEAEDFTFTVGLSIALAGT